MSGLFCKFTSKIMFTNAAQIISKIKDDLQVVLLRYVVLSAIVYKTNNKYYEILTLYECVEILLMTISCNIWMICFKLNWFFYEKNYKAKT